MANRKIGPIIRDLREKHGLTREQLAKRLKISAAYTGHLERSAPVTLSDRVVNALIKALGKRANQLKMLQESHNRKSRIWYSAYRKRRAKQQLLWESEMDNRKRRTKQLRKSA